MSSSVAKLLAGVGMMVPGFILHTFAIKNNEQKTTKEATLETAKLGGSVAAVSGIITLTTIGVFHVLSGASDLSPKICWRE